MRSRTRSPTWPTTTRATGPYGRYPADGPLAGESVDGSRLVLDDDRRASLGERLAAGLEHTHLLVYRPREASGADLDPPSWRRAGASDAIVTLSQFVAFLAFQQRVAAGLRGPQRGGGGMTEGTHSISDVSNLTHTTLPTRTPSPGARWAGCRGWSLREDTRPNATTRDSSTAARPCDYFRLLVRDPGILGRAPCADKDIFYNTEEGLPRAERELAAAAAIRRQRLHLLRVRARALRAHHSQRKDLVDRLLEEGM